MRKGTIRMTIMMQMIKRTVKYEEVYYEENKTMTMMIMINEDSENANDFQNNDDDDIDNNDDNDNNDITGNIDKSADDDLLAVVENALPTRERDCCRS